MPHRGFYKLCQLKTAAILFVIIIGLVSATPGALAADAGGDADTQQGIKLFNEKKYGPAILAFGRALKRKPKDPGLFYLLGACYDQGGDRNTAKKFFSYAVQYGPGTKGGSLASQALAKLDPQYQMKLQAGSGQGASTSGLKQQVGSGQGASASGLKQQTGLQGTGSRASSVSASASQASDVSGLPREDRVYYTSMGQHQIVDAAVNNRRIQMLFDTGAEVCAFGKNHLEELQIPIPANARTGYAQGVGVGGMQKTSIIPVTLKVGHIERKNFLISIQPHMDGAPLLGQSFFKDFHYTIDAGSRSIHFVRNDHHQSQQSRGSIYQTNQNTRYDVPFRREGKELVVNVEINGRKIEMYFDTGASMVALTQEHLQQIGLTIPSDASEGTVQGIAGSSRSWNFPVKSIKMGPIEKFDHEISVVEHSQMRHPLMGQRFFGDWRYSIDNVKQVIRFRR